MKPQFSQVSTSVPFDNSNNGFSAQDVQAAIEEVRTYHRYVAVCGYQGNANTNTYLQFFRSNPSNTTPFIVAESSEIKSLSLAAEVAATTTINIYKNGSMVTSISLANQTQNVSTGLSISVASGDKLSAKVASGSARNPNLYIFLRIT